MFLNAVQEHISALICSHTFVILSSLSFASAGQTDALHVHVPTAETRSHVSESASWMFHLKKTNKNKCSYVSKGTHWDPGTL